MEEHTLPKTEKGKDLVYLCLSHGSRFLIWPAAAACMALIVSLLIRPVYVATAVILPPQQLTGHGFSALSQLGSAMELLGSGTGLKNPEDMYVGILRSRTIADSIISQFNLQHIYHCKYLSVTEKKLASNTKIETSKDSLIDISVGDHSAKRAADLANAYVAELYKQNQRLALTTASQERMFLEQKLLNEKNKLEDAEVALQKTEEKTGVIQLPSQTELILREASQLRAEIASRQVELQGLMAGATNENPEVVRLQTEIEGLQNQLNRLEQGSAAAGTGQIPASQVPSKGLEYIRSLREVEFQQALYSTLLRLYETAQLDEAQSAQLIQVVDKAVVPDRKTWPSKALFTVGGLFLGLIAAFCSVLFSLRWREVSSHPLHRERVAAARTLLHLRR